MKDDPQIIDIVEGRSYLRLPETGCLLCGVKYITRQIGTRFGMTAWVAECPQCRLAYQTPQPSPEASRAYMNWRWRSTDAYVASISNQVKRANKQLDLVQTYFDRPMKMLDFGAGAGAFVHAAIKRGWQAIGVEQSESARKRAREYYGIDLVSELGEGTYDVVTMWDVIEHISDPINLLATLRDHLAPGGLLFLETGNYESWLRVYEKDRWVLYLFDHQFYFTPSSLEQVTNRAGYANFNLLDTNHIYPWKPWIILRHPLGSGQTWWEWRRAKRVWGIHGDIHVMVGVVSRLE
jgi:2-polyprenyl-3-methyl-5-hydroxy-6-metoxy-1,4-benzoquinol methylase